jgi:ribosomal protein S18 acetylase RimI-like enzyme
VSTVLRAMREEEYAGYLERAKRRYREDIVANGGLLPGVAREKAEADYARILPDGLATAGAAVLVVEHDGSPAGVVFFAEREQFGRRAAWLYEITIDPELRGRGIGRRAMELLEDEVRARGLQRIELNVFGGNEVARGLYRSLGYAERAVVMDKDLT